MKPVIPFKASDFAALFAPKIVSTTPLTVSNSRHFTNSEMDNWKLFWALSFSLFAILAAFAIMQQNYYLMKQNADLKNVSMKLLPAPQKADRIQKRSADKFTSQPTNSTINNPTRSSTTA